MLSSFSLLMQQIQKPLGGQFLPLTLALRAPPPIVSHSFAFPRYNLAVPSFLLVSTSVFLSPHPFGLDPRCSSAGIQMRERESVVGRQRGQKQGAVLTLGRRLHRFRGGWGLMVNVYVSLLCTCLGVVIYIGCLCQSRCLSMDKPELIK